jgi:hypothetical protein
MHRTDIDQWFCQCASYNHSPYHICTMAHVLRLYGRPYPLKGESIRQHARPLVWIQGLHCEDQKFHHVPEAAALIEHRLQPGSVEELGLTQEYLEAMSQWDQEVEPELSRYEEQRAQYEEFIENIEAACKYARAELGTHSRERFARLPKPDAKGFKTLIKLAQNAHVIDHSRRRRPTWSAVRRGANLYRS